MLVVAVVVRVDSPGGAIFRQERVRRERRRVPDAEVPLDGVTAESELARP